MATLLERLAKLKGVEAPAAVPTPPSAPAPVAAAPPKMAEYASAMPDVKKKLVGKVTVVEDELGFTFIAPYADEIEWEALHKKFGSEHKGWILSTGRRVVEGKGERIATYLRPEAKPAPVVAVPVAVPLTAKPKTLSERLRERAVTVPAPAPAPAPLVPAPKPVIIPTTPEMMEAMRERLKAMPLEGLKAMYKASRAISMVPAEKTLLLEEVEKRGLFKVEKPVPAAPPLAPGTVTYELLSKDEKLNREKFDTFMREWGLDLEREEHKKAADWVWDYLKKNKALPPFETIPTEEKNFIYRNYMGKLRERLGKELEVQVARRGLKSVDELVGELWTKYGRNWVRIPPVEFGVPKYPGELSPEVWHDRFLSVVMSGPYNARPRRAQELYNEYGRFGKMPPLTEFVLPREIMAAVEKGAEPSDADAVVDFYKEADRPLTRLDFLTIFGNDERRAGKAEKTMEDYTEDHFLHETYRIIDDMVKTSEGREKLKGIALTDNRRIFADLIADKAKGFKRDKVGFIDLAYDSLLEYLPSMLPVEERNDFIAKKEAKSPSDLRKDIRVEMDKLRPGWADIQAMEKDKDLTKKWADLKAELKDVSAMDFFMRYPEVSKERARALEEYLKFGDIKKLWEGNLPTQMQIEKMVPELVKRAGEFKPGDSKAKLETDLALLERLDDLYMYHTGQHLVTKVSVGNILRDVDIIDAEQFAKDVFKLEWLTENDYETVSKLVQEKLRVPTEADFFKVFGDPARARVVADLFKDYKVPVGVKLSEDTIRQIANFKGLTGGEVEAAVLSFRGSGEFPLSKVERVKVEDLRKRQKAARLFIEVVGRAVPREVRARLEEIKTLSASQAIMLQKYNDFISEREQKVAEVNKKLEEIEKRRVELVEKGTRQQREATEGEIVEAEEERKNLFAALSAARHERLAFLKTLPKIDYTRGQARIEYKDYVNRRAFVRDQDVPVTLEDIYQYWVGPLELQRKEFVAKNKREPESYELLAMEPAVDKILAEEKEGKKVADKEKKVAVIVLMNYARELGAYPFEYEMATLARDLGVKDVPLFALPGGSAEARQARFAEWLRFGLTRHEVEDWDPHVQLAFIGDDWASCEWEGEPKSIEDVAGQKAHIEACAIHKAKASQSVALQFVEPRLLEPIIVEAAEVAPPSEGLKKLLDENEKLKKSLKEKTEQLATAMAFGTEAKKKLTTVADLEAKIAAMEQQLGAPAAAITTEGKRRLIIRRIPTAEEVEGVKRRKETVQKELEAEVGTEKARAAAKGLEEKIEELSELARKIEQERAKARGVCFLPDEWVTIKVSIGEHIAANSARLADIQSRLGGARASGLTIGATAYESELRALKDEADVLEKLVDYIRGVEVESPGRFFCTESEKGMRG